MTKFHVLEIAGISRSLPIVPVSETMNVAFLKLYGDTELTEVAATALAAKLDPQVDVILAPESGGILLSHLVSARCGVPYILARKKARPNMVQPLFVEVETIGTAGVQRLYIDQRDVQTIRNSSVALIDEVVSSGSTVNALKELVRIARGRVVQILAVATEGEENLSVTKLAHLPLYPST